MAECERITCDEVQVGDRIARTRTSTFQEVLEIHEGPAARRLIFSMPTQPYQRHGYGDNIRPRRTAKLWREVSA